MRTRVKRSKSGKIAGVVFFVCAGLLYFLLIKAMLGTTLEQGLLPISIIFGGFGTAFLLSGIFTFGCEKFIRKVIITFFVFTGCIIVAVIAATAVMVRIWGMGG